MTHEVKIGNCLDLMKEMPSESVQACITSPPYWRLRKYGDDPKELGQEATPEEFVANLTPVFEEVRRILKPDGTFWLVIGDSYTSNGRERTEAAAVAKSTLKGSTKSQGNQVSQGSKLSSGLKALDLVGIPWLTAFGLRSAGWYLRSSIIWHKKNCMPESVGRKNGKWTFQNGRPTRSHENVFLFSKSPKYYYDSQAISEPCIWDVDGTRTAARKARAHSETKSYPTEERNGMRGGGFKDAAKMNGKNGVEKQRGHSRKHSGFNDRWGAMTKEEQCSGRRNKRDVWIFAPSQFREAHYATFPPALIEPMILASSKPGDTVLDPFGGSGTVAMVSQKFGRSSISIDLYPKHGEMMLRRTFIPQMDFSEYL